MLLTDSTADLSPEYLIKEDVQSIPLFIRFEEEVYKDGVDLTPDELFIKVEEKKELARSTGLRSGDFHNAFNKYIKRVMILSISALVQIYLRPFNQHSLLNKNSQPNKFISSIQKRSLQGLVYSLCAQST